MIVEAGMDTECPETPTTRGNVVKTLPGPAGTPVTVPVADEVVPFTPGIGWQNPIEVPEQLTRIPMVQGGHTAHTVSTLAVHAVCW